MSKGLKIALIWFALAVVVTIGIQYVDSIKSYLKTQVETTSKEVADQVAKEISNSLSRELDNQMPNNSNERGQ